MPLRVILESPFAAASPDEAKRNRTYLFRAMMDSLGRGEAPFASHGVYPFLLDDLDPVERGIGLAAGWAWIGVADLMVVYADLGVSPGMQQGIDRAAELNLPVARRHIGAGA